MNYLLIDQHKRVIRTFLKILKLNELSFLIMGIWQIQSLVFFALVDEVSIQIFPNLPLHISSAIRQLWARSIVDRQVF